MNDLEERLRAAIVSHELAKRGMRYALNKHLIASYAGHREAQERARLEFSTHGEVMLDRIEEILMLQKQAMEIIKNTEE